MARMIFLAVFLISLSALAFEVLLARVFSINQWNHLSFMVISIALFGFAASGTWLAVRRAGYDDRKTRLSPDRTIRILLLLFYASVVIAYLALNNMPLDYFRLPLEPMQAIYLLVAYLLLAAPFFAAGLVISITYAVNPEKSGITYFASMAGSACGAALPYFLLPYMEEGRLITIVAILPLCALYGPPSPLKHRPLPKGIHRRSKSGLYVLVSALIAATFLLPMQIDVKRFLAVKPSEYKSLSQTLRLPDMRIISTQTGIRGRIDRVAGPSIRHAPGLSLKYHGDLPLQTASFRDGDNRLVFYENPGTSSHQFARSLLAYAGYRMVPDPQRVLIVLNGGGSSIACALAAGAKQVDILEANPHMARQIRQHYRLPVINQPARRYLSSSRERYDIIQIDNQGSSLPGSAALDQGYEFTLASFNDYLLHLNQRGLIIITRNLLLPPSDALRMWATAFESLKALGVGTPLKHLAMLRNWDTYTLIVGRRPLPPTSKWRDIAVTHNFDLLFSHDIRPEWANRFFVSKIPFHYQEIQRLKQAYLDGTQHIFFRDYPLDIKPQTDDRPFPNRVIKWHRLYDFYRSMGHQFYAMMLSSEIVVGVVLLEAALITVALLALPRRIMPKCDPRSRALPAGYFLALGAGYMFTEMYFIYEFVILFGDPVVSLIVVLGAILIFSAAGGYVSQSFRRQHLPVLLLLLVLLLMTVTLTLEPIVTAILRWPSCLQVATVFTLLLPAGLLAGMPFPIGMRHLLISPVERAQAWAANGCTSVLASIVSAQMALSVGISWILAAAALAYGFAFICVVTMRKKPA